MSATPRYRTVVDLYVLLQRADGRILLLERANTGYADGLLCPPSGHMEAGESMAQGAAREANEEVGVGIDPAALEFVHVVHHRSSPEKEGRVGVFFVARQWSGAPYNREPGKCARLVWADPGDMPGTTVPYTAAAMAAIAAGHPFSLDGWPTTAAQPDAAGQAAPLGAPTPHVHESELVVLGPDALPADLAALVESVAGPVQAVVDRSQARKCSVFQVTTSDGQVFAKRHLNDHFHQREVHAYTSFVAWLSQGRTPRLLASDAGTRAVVLTALPGTPLLEAGLTAEQQLGAYRSLGGLIRGLHDCVPAVAARPTRFAERARSHLARTLGLVGAADRKLLLAYCARLDAIAPELPLRQGHGDLQERNIVVLPGTSEITVGLLDFERTELAMPSREVVRLQDGPWASNPALREAYFHGYGRTPSPLEAEAELGHAAADCASALAWGPTHPEDPEVLERAHRTLARLRALGTP